MPYKYDFQKDTNDSSLDRLLGLLLLSSLLKDDEEEEEKKPVEAAKPVEKKEEKEKEKKETEKPAAKEKPVEEPTSRTRVLTALRKLHDGVRELDVAVGQYVPKVPQPRTGRWINQYYCSECFSKDDKAGMHNYCPFCGVKMPRSQTPFESAFESFEDLLKETKTSNKNYWNITL